MKRVFRNPGNTLLKCKSRSHKDLGQRVIHQPYPDESQVNMKMVYGRILYPGLAAVNRRLSGNSLGHLLRWEAYLPPSGLFYFRTVFTVRKCFLL